MMTLHREIPVINTDAHIYVYLYLLYFADTDNVILIFYLNYVYLQGQTSGDYLHDHPRRFAHRGCPWRCIPRISQK